MNERISVLFRLCRPTWVDLDEQEASYTSVDHIQAERSRSASIPGANRAHGLQAHRGLRAELRDELLNLERFDTRDEENASGALTAYLQKNQAAQFTGLQATST